MIFFLSLGLHVFKWTLMSQILFLILLTCNSSSDNLW